MAVTEVMYSDILLSFTCEKLLHIFFLFKVCLCFCFSSCTFAPEIEKSCSTNRTPISWWLCQHTVWSSRYICSRKIWSLSYWQLWTKYTRSSNTGTRMSGWIYINGKRWKLHLQYIRCNGKKSKPPKWQHNYRTFQIDAE